MDEIIIKSGTTCRSILLAAGNDIPEPAGSGICGFELLYGRESSRHIVLEENAAADFFVLIMPGADTGLDFRIELAGPGASCRLFGLYLCPCEENVSINVVLSHKVPRCSSHQLFKGIVSGTSRAGFFGKIVVDPDAQATEAYQENHSLLLSDTARVDTQPQLEIYADDVKCSHGAAIGELNEEEQFYMRSRGIPENEAKVLQMVSFVSSVLDMLPEGEARENLASYVERTVRSSF